jgi:hypothetical protein
MNRVRMRGLCTVREIVAIWSTAQKFSSKCSTTTHPAMAFRSYS